MPIKLVLSDKTYDLSVKEISQLAEKPVAVQ